MISCAAKLSCICVVSVCFVLGCERLHIIGYDAYIIAPDGSGLVCHIHGVTFTINNVSPVLDPHIYHTININGLPSWLGHLLFVPSSPLPDFVTGDWADPRGRCRGDLGHELGHLDAAHLWDRCSSASRPRRVDALVVRRDAEEAPRWKRMGNNG